MHLATVVLVSLAGLSVLPSCSSPAQGHSRSSTGTATATAAGASGAGDIRADGPSPLSLEAPVGTAAADDPLLDRASALLAQAQSAKERGDYGLARAKVVEAIDGLLSEDEGKDTDTEARTALLADLGTFAHKAGETGAGERAREHVLEILSRTLPEDHADLQIARGSLAITIKTLGDLQGARALEEKVLEVFSRTLPDDHPDLQTARLNLAGTLYSLGDLQGARALQEKVLEVFSRTLPEDHPDLQIARGNLAITIKTLGDLQGARALEERVLEVFSRTLPDDHPDLQTARGNLAGTIKKLGDLQGARALEELVLELRSRTLPDYHPHLQAARGNLATTMHSLGDLQGAWALQEKVLEVCSRTLPEDHPELQKARLNFAATLYSLGDLQGARALQEKVLEVCSRSLPEDHPELQRTRGNLAATIKALGDVHGARALEEKVLEIRSRTLPEDHPHLQAARANLAGTLHSLGDLQGARALEEKVLEVSSRTLPEDHPELQRARANLAATIKALGDLQGARALEEKVLEVCSRTLPEDHPHLQVARQSLAATIKALGDLQGARARFEQVLEVRLRTLPDDHPDLQAARLNLAVTIAAETARLPREGEGERTRAREAGKERSGELVLAFCRAQVDAVRKVLVSNSSREAEERCVRLTEELGLALSFARGYGVFEPSPELEAPAFALSETARGAAIAAADLARRAAGAPKYAEMREALAKASDELAGLAQMGMTGAGFDAARVKRESAERELISLAREMSGGELGGVELDLPSLARRLGEHTASVSFRRFKGWRIDAARESDAGGDPAPLREVSTESLCAFVVRGCGPADASGIAAGCLTLVDLGPIAPIETAVRDWREAIGAAQGRGLAFAPSVPAANPRASGDILRQLVFDPLLPSIGERERVVLVLDDVLHLAAFDALPLDSRGTLLLGDRWKIETRATLGELWNANAPTEGKRSLLAIGGVRYGSEGPEASHPPAVLRGGAWSAGFSELPATAEEAAGIGAAFAGAFGADAHAMLLTHSDASRQRLLELAPGARFLHIATHGWFAPESIPSWRDPEPLDKHSGLALRLSGEEQVRGMSPMLLCGLALAGANLPENELGRAPGLVTADELAALDLSSCELAVLSACDTNVGERRAGQGVASLQRALQMAGARTVVTSLWKVPDEATKELMLDFYRRIWVGKKPKGQALWEAKKRLRAAQDESGNPRYTTRDWAAWVLTGEPE